MPNAARLLLVSVALFAFALNAPAAGSVLFTTLGPNGQFDSTNGDIIGGFNSEVIANAFVPASTGKLGEAILIAQYNSYYPGNSPINVYLETDSAGQPGAILDTLTQVGMLNTLPTPITYGCTFCPVLKAGTTYWIVAVQPDPNSVDGWKFSYGDQPGLVGANFAGSPTGPWVTFTNPLSAFQIDAAIPEPTSVLLLCTGATALLSAKLRKMFPGG